jgi:histidinol-phosphate phosphatase family protein
MKIVFLDRDGVINKYPGDNDYVKSWKEFSFLPNALKAIRDLSRKKFKIFIISNQAGVSKGIYSLKELNYITKKMLNEIKKNDGKIEGVFYCIHRKEDNCSCRKPRTALVKLALKKLGLKKLNKHECFFIGDDIKDILTGKRAGCKTILVLSGKEKLKNKKLWQLQPDFISEDLFSASRIILDSLK